MQRRGASLAMLLTALCLSRGGAAAASPEQTNSAPSPAPSTVAAATPATAPPATRPGTIFTEESAPLPADPGDHKLRFHTQVNGKRVDMAVLLHLPPGYRAREAGGGGAGSPLIVFMHGGGECGSDCAAIYTNGPMTMLRKGDRDPRFAASFPFVLLAPQCPPRGQRWDQEPMIKAVVALMDDFIPRANVDADRVYITGLSMGGAGTWRVAYLAADKFAAVAPMSAVSYKPSELAARLWHTSVWSVVGAQDSDWFLGGTRQMDNALAGSPADIRFTYLVGNGHDAWWPTYASPQFYEWLLAQRRPHDSAAASGLGTAVAAAPPASQPSAPQASLAAAPPSTQPLATTRPSSPLPQSPGHYRLVFNTSIAAQPYPLDYLLYLPRSYRPQGPPSPAMLFLHEEHAIGPDIDSLCPHGPNLELARPDSSLSESFPFVVISPRLPIKCDWTSPGINEALLALLDHVQTSLNLDRSRISISGINDGAAEAVSLAAAAPERFAAAVPLMNEGPLPLADNQVKPLSTVAGWVQMRPTQAATIDRIKSLSSTGRLNWRVGLLQAPSDAALPVDTSLYADHQFLAWLQQQRRSPAAARTAATD